MVGANLLRPSQLPVSVYRSHSVLAYRLQDWQRGNVLQTVCWWCRTDGGLHAPVGYVGVNSSEDMVYCWAMRSCTDLPFSALLLYFRVVLSICRHYVKSQSLPRNQSELIWQKAHHHRSGQSERWSSGKIHLPSTVPLKPLIPVVWSGPASNKEFVSHTMSWSVPPFLQVHGSALYPTHRQTDVYDICSNRLHLYCTLRAGDAA